MTLTQDVQLVTIIAAIVTACMAIVNFRKSIEERRLDLRWKMANAATAFVHEMHLDKRTGDAISMLDWLHLDKKPAGDAEEEPKHIKHADLMRILSLPDDHICSPHEHYVLQCFDWLFYFIDRMEQNIRDGLFLFDNVKYIFLPYYEKISKDRSIFRAFTVKHRYLLADGFWTRFDDDDFWKVLPDGANASAKVITV